MTRKDFSMALTDYARELRAKFSLRVPFDPEDQLKKPMTTLVESAGQNRFKEVDKEQW